MIETADGQADAAFGPLIRHTEVLIQKSPSMPSLVSGARLPVRMVRSAASVIT
jgi:hypothetical protein